jgi:hypothetical protein
MHFLSARFAMLSVEIPSQFLGAEGQLSRTRSQWYCRVDFMLIRHQLEGRKNSSLSPFFIDPRVKAWENPLKTVLAFG